MSPGSHPLDSHALRKQNLLRIFYVSSVGCAITVGAAPYLRSVWKDLLLLGSLLCALLAVWTLVRFLRVIDEFEARYLHGALRIAFVGMVSLLAVEAFLENFGFPRIPAYGNVLCAVILWSLGLAVTSWQQHWRRGYEK